MGVWKTIEYVEKNKYRPFSYYYSGDSKIYYEGEIDVYQFNDIEIKIPKNINLNSINPPKDRMILTKKMSRYLLFLLSSSFKNNYSIFSENTFIKMRQYLIYYKYNIFPIYKNGKYIVKNEFNINYYYENIPFLAIYESIDIIYYIISIFGNKYYTDNNQLILKLILSMKI